MSSFYNRIPEPDEMIVCPYDNVHVVAYKRFQYHLLKCARNHQNKKVKTCSFNARHVVFEEKFLHHECTCPDRHLVERPVVQESSTNSWVKGCTDVPTYFPDCDVPDAEMWEDEPAPRRVGVPAREMAGIGYYKDVTGLKPAQKKQFYKNLSDKNHEANVRLMESLNLEKEDNASYDVAVPVGESPWRRGGTQVNGRTQANTPSLANASPAKASLAQPYLGGRGRGRGALGLLAQPRVGIASTAAAPSAAAVPAAAAAADVTDPKKLIRKVEKKLRQIDHLVERQAQGETLNEEERVKVSLKNTLEVQLHSLREQLPSSASP